MPEKRSPLPSKPLADMAACIRAQRSRPSVGSRMLWGGRVVAASSVPLLMMLAIPEPSAYAMSPLAPIADQPGVTAPVQPGTDVPAPPPAPAPTVYEEQPPEIRNGPSPRPEPSPAPAPPVYLIELHSPEPVEPVAPIEAPENTIRIGQTQIPEPDWLPPEVGDTINTVAADIEAQAATFLDSIGLPAGRSDRVAGATVGGAGVGGAIGGALVGAPAAAAGAVVGGLAGGTLGGIAGAALGTVVTLPVVGTITSGVAGTALGAAAGAVAGAVVAGVPVAALGALVGGTVGGAIGAGAGVGQP